MAIVGDSISLGLCLDDDPSLRHKPFYTWFGSIDFIGDVLPGDGGGYQLAFKARGSGAIVHPRTYAGMCVAWFNKDQARTGMDAAGQTRTYTLNPARAMLNCDPDAVFFMLGANDAVDYATNDSKWGKPYKAYFRQELTQISDTLSAYVNSRGKHLDVYIGTVTPLRVPPSPGEFWSKTWTQTDIDQRSKGMRAVPEEINPLIRELASHYKFHLVDTYGAIMAAGSQWESSYGDQVHLNESGRKAVRAAFLDAYMNVKPAR